MVFVRRRGNSHTLIDSYRAGGKVRQRIVANLGPYPSVQAAMEAEPEKFGHLAEATKPVVSPVVSVFERRVQAEVEKRVAAMAATAPPPPAKAAEERPVDLAPLLAAVRALIGLFAERGGVWMRRATQMQIVKGLHPDHVADPKLKPLFDAALKAFNAIPPIIREEEQRRKEHAKRMQRQAAAEKGKATRAASAAARARREGEQKQRGET